MVYLNFLSPPLILRIMNDNATNSTTAAEKKRELLGFLFLTVITAPVLSVLVVSGYGFLVWFYQILAGPPTQ